jgi:hypothetical protein
MTTPPSSSIPPPSDPLPASSNSEVSRILTQIAAEYEAAQRGLEGLALGNARHDFITRRMERMGTLHRDLHDLVGDTAIMMISQALDNQSQQSL